MKGGSFFMAKKWAGRVRNWMAKKMDLPQDVIMDLPRITMIGQIHVYIENHRGLLVFTDKELRLLLKQGQLLIKGKSFVIKTILPEEILLEGKIDQVVYINDDNPGGKI
jgi:sporulation protein YqfC